MREVSSPPAPASKPGTMLVAALASLAAASLAAPVPPAAGTTGPTHSVVSVQLNQSSISWLLQEFPPVRQRVGPVTYNAALLMSIHNSSVAKS